MCIYSQRLTSVKHFLKVQNKIHIRALHLININYLIVVEAVSDESRLSYLV